MDGRYAKQVAGRRAATNARKQKQADRYWEPLLKKWTDWLGDKRHREEAENLLATVVDRRAKPSILKLFPIDRSEADQLHRLRLLARLDDPSSSRAIANQAIQTRFESVRRTAIELLKKRPPRDYAGNLVEMIHGTIRYEVQAVSGSDSRGRAGDRGILDFAWCELMTCLLLSNSTGHSVAISATTTTACPWLRRAGSWTT